MNKYSQFNLALFNARKQKGLTQEQLSSMSGVSVTTIQLIEHGKKDVTLRSALGIARALDMSVEDLFPERKNKS